MQVLVSFPSLVEKYSSYFQHCFSEEGFIHFKKAVSGFIVSENKTISGINRLFLEHQCDQSNFNRFFNNASLDLRAINEARIDMLQSCAALLEYVFVRLQKGTFYSTDLSTLWC